MTKNDALRLLQLALQVLRREPNVLFLSDPLTVVGDIHGQLYDLQPLFAQGGDPSQRKYLFLGDYVDRGAWSTEVALLILAMKVAMPNSIFMLRGNHEAREITARYGYREDCLRKYDAEVYEATMLAFDALPLAAVVDQKYFCVHGGLSPKFQTPDEINRVQRFQDVPLADCLTVDLLWSDPVDNTSGQLQGPYVFNSDRGCGTKFGREALNRFLQANRLKAMVRAHEVFFEGFSAHNWNGSDLWQVCTIFSAPNYTNHYQNVAAVMKIDNGNSQIAQFLSAPQPYCEYEFPEVISYTMPILSKRIVEMFKYLWQKEFKTIQEMMDPRELSEINQKIAMIGQATDEQANKAAFSYNQGSGSGPASNGLANNSGLDSQGRFAAFKAADLKNEALPEDINGFFKNISSNAKNFFDDVQPQTQPRVQPQIQPQVQPRVQPQVLPPQISQIPQTYYGGQLIRGPQSIPGYPTERPRTFQPSQGYTGYPQQTIQHPTLPIYQPGYSRLPLPSYTHQPSPYQPAPVSGSNYYLPLNQSSVRTPYPQPSTFTSNPNPTSSQWNNYFR